jgi:hypothetical protein
LFEPKTCYIAMAGVCRKILGDAGKGEQLVTRI